MLHSNQRFQGEHITYKFFVPVNDAMSFGTTHFFNDLSDNTPWFMHGVVSRRCWETLRLAFCQSQKIQLLTASPEVPIVMELTSWHRVVVFQWPGRFATLGPHFCAKPRVLVRTGRLSRRMPWVRERIHVYLISIWRRQNWEAYKVLVVAELFVSQL